MILFGKILTIAKKNSQLVFSPLQNPLWNNQSIWSIKSFLILIYHIGFILLYRCNRTLFKTGALLFTLFMKWDEIEGLYFRLDKTGAKGESKERLDLSVYITVIKVFYLGNLPQTAYIMAIQLD